MTERRAFTGNQGAGWGVNKDGGTGIDDTCSPRTGYPPSHPLNYYSDYNNKIPFFPILREFYTYWEQCYGFTRSMIGLLMLVGWLMVTTIFD